MPLLETIIQHRVRAGVLQLTLGIALIISIILSSVLLLAYYSKIEFLQFQIQDKLTRNALSGIQVIIGQRDLPFQKKIGIDLFLDTSDSVEIIRKPWGLFEVAVSRAYQGNRSVTKSALITPAATKAGKSAMYVPDDNAPLYLVGDTFIRGGIYMSERKMSSGYIDGKSFSRKRFFEGKAYKSDAQMPMIDTVLLTEWSSVMQHRPSAYNPQADEAMLLRSHFTFYDDKTNYWFSDQSIVLDNTLTGNLVIHSGVSIHITSAARLNNVIVMAPEIILDENVEASVQCMATKIIRVGRNSRLLYPSSLVLDGGENDSTIVMEQGATLQGIVLIPGSDRIVGSKASFRLEKGAVLHGMAYVNGAADISGSIFGHITAKRFQTTLDKVVYGNHLLDAVIDADKRSIYMPGTFVWGDSSHLIIAKWIER